MNHHESLGHSMEISTTSLLLQQVRKRTYLYYLCICPKNSGTQWFLGALLWVAVPLHCAPHAVSKVHTYRAEWWCDPYVSRRYRRRRNIIRAERDLGLPILRMRAAQKHGAE